MGLYGSNFFGNGGVYTPYSAIRRRSTPAPSSDLAAQRAELQRKRLAGEISAADFYSQISALNAQGRAEANMTPEQKLAAEFQKAYDEAKAANEGRYKDILGTIDKMGGQERQDINAAFNAAEGRGQQDLVTSGLAGTTVLPSMRAGVTRERTSALGRLEDRLRGQRIGVMERREDEYPDYGQLMTLAQLQGRAGGLGTAGGAGGMAGGGLPSYVRPQTLDFTPPQFVTNPGYQEMLRRRRLALSTAPVASTPSQPGSLFSDLWS